MAVVGEDDTSHTDLKILCSPFVLLAGDGTPILSSTANGPKFTLTHITECLDGVPATLNT